MRRLSDAAIDRVAARYSRRPARPTALVVRREELETPAALEARLWEAVGYRWTARRLIAGMRRQPAAEAWRVEPVAGGHRGWTYTPIEEQKQP